MGNFASGKRALGVCDVCGFSYKLRELKALVVKHRVTSVLACPTCWNPDNPQNNIGDIRVLDPQALRNPRPDSNQFAESRAQIIPVTSVYARAVVGYVTISTI